MKNKLTVFVRSFYFNSDVLKAYKIGGFLAFILFLVNIMLISFPPVRGAITSTPDYEDFPGINEAFHDIYEREIPCVLDDFSLTCDGEVDSFQAGAYRFEIVDEMRDDLDVSENTIYLGETEAAIIYVDEDDNRTILSSNYATQPTLDFSTVMQRAEDSDDMTAYYDRQTQSFMNNLYFSEVASTMLIIYPAQLAQIGLYVLLVGFMLLISNYKAKMKKLTVGSALKITVSAMTGPALVAALLGIFIPQWAVLIFTIAYLVRIVALYFEISASDQPFFIEKTKKI